jgi:GNAT superfamily N-acetyltransferase
MAGIRIKDLTPALWPALEALFGNNGACGGCWCMTWRIEKGERWDDVKGKTAKRRMKALVGEGKALGALAFVGDDAVGWCSYGPRTDYPKLNRARTLACDDADRVWSLPCFFIKREWRGSGVATALLAHAVKSLGQRGVEVIEGYPVKPARQGQKTPDAFAWTGTRAMFEACGFELVGSPSTSKLRMRKKLA